MKINKIRKNILCILFLAHCTPLFAQQPEEPKVFVNYMFRHMKDTSNRANPYWEKMVLYIGKEHTVYKSFNSIASRQEIRKLKSEGKDWHKSDSIKFMMGKASTDQLFFNPKKSKLIRTSRILATDYIYDESYPMIKWEIGKGKRKIGNYNCQDAVGTYAGRVYHVWFTKDLPYKVGPWKLVGLPGLILEAKDTKGEVSFMYENIGFGSPEVGEFVELSDVAERKPEQELKKIVEMAQKNPNIAYDSAMQQAEVYKAQGKRAYAKDQRIVIPAAQPGEGQSSVRSGSNPIELKKDGVN